MAKFIKKEDLAFEDGYIMNGDDIVFISQMVVNEANALEQLWQEFQYLHDQPAEQKAPSLDGFKRISNCTPVRIVEPITPTLDAAIAKAIDFMKDISKTETAKLINSVAEEFAELIKWLDSEKVVAEYNWVPDQFDTPYLGNPLILTGDQVYEMLKRIGDEFPWLLEHELKGDMRWPNKLTRFCKPIDDDRDCSEF